MEDSAQKVNYFTSRNQLQWVSPPLTAKVGTETVLSAVEKAEAEKRIAAADAKKAGQASVTQP